MEEPLPEVEEVPVGLSEAFVPELEPEVEEVGEPEFVLRVSVEPQVVPAKGW